MPKSIHGNFYITHINFQTRVSKSLVRVISRLTNLNRVSFKVLNYICCAVPVFRCQILCSHVAVCLCLHLSWEFLGFIGYKGIVVTSVSPIIATSTTAAVAAAAAVTAPVSDWSGFIFVFLFVDTRLRFLLFGSHITFDSQIIIDGVTASWRILTIYPGCWSRSIMF